jgi:flavodoxin
MKKWMAWILTAVIMVTLSACGNSNPSSQSSTTDGTAVSAASGTGSADTEKSSTLQSGETSASVENTGSGKPLVVYFSWSGHLQQMAEWVADETGGDLIRVVPKKAYPDDYNATADRAKKEQDDGTRPGINVDLTQEQLAQYDTVFLGFPVWWYDLPMPMWTFLESYDFSGKTIIPFFSHEGSSNGANALPTVTSLASGADVRTDDALSIRGGDVAGSEDEVRTWVRNLGFGK